MDLGRIIQQMSANSDFAFSEEYESIESGDQLPRTVSLLLKHTDTYCPACPRS